MPEFLSEDITENCKNRIQHTKLHFTYKTFIDKDELLNFFREITTKSEKEILAYYSIVHEVGITGYQHTHAFIEWSYTFISRDLNYFDYNNENKIHPNIRKVKHQNYVNNILEYHKKFDKNPKENISGKYKNKNKSIYEIQTMFKEKYGGDLERMIEEEKVTYKDYMSVVSPSLGFKTITIESNESSIDSWYPWKKNLYKELSKPARNEIIWYVDIAGDTGKRDFINHFVKYKEGTIYTQPGSYDFLFEKLIEHQSMGGKFKYFFTKTSSIQQIPKTFFMMMLRLKEGLELSSIKQNKKLSTVNIKEKMHVVIFSKDFPPLDKSYFDKLKVRIINYDCGVTKELHCMDIINLAEKYKIANRLSTFWSIFKANNQDLFN